MRINVRCPIYSPTGYGQISRLVVKALLERDFEVLLSPIGTGSGFFDDLVRPPDDNAPGLVIAPPTEVFPLGRPRFALVFGESVVPPPGSSARLSLFDKVLVMSNFVARIFSGVGVDRSRIAVLPPIVDRSLFNPENTPLFVKNIRPFVILFVGDLILRKGWDRLLKAACVFNTNDDVCILLKTTSRQAQRVERVKREIGLRVPILLCQRSLGPKKIARLYQVPRKLLPDREYAFVSRDVRGVFALPSLGEGLGLPYLEAMSSGLLTLGTNATGQNEIVRSDRAIVVPSLPLRREYALELERPYYRGQPFFDVDVNAVKDALLRAYNLSDAERSRLVSRALDFSRSFTPSRFVDAFLELL